MRDLSTISFKLAAVLIGVFALQFVPRTVIALLELQGELDFAFIATTFMLVICAAVAGALWLAAAPLSRRLFREESASPLQAITAGELQAVAFSVVGLVVLVSSVRDIVWSLAYFVESGPNMPRINIIAGAAAATFTIVVGVWLLLGAKGIVNAIQKLRG